MTTLQYNEEQKLLKQTIADFVAEKLTPIAKEIDEQDTCPMDIFKEMGAKGFLSVFAPEEFGGAGLGFTERGIILEELARHSAGFALFSMTHDLAVMAINGFGSPEQKNKYLPDLVSGKSIGGLAVTEPSGGSNFLGQETSAEIVDGKWRLNGRKCFITNSHIANTNIVTAKSGIDPKGRPALTAFILESSMEGFAPGRKDKKAGLRGSVMGDVVMSNIQVSEDFVLGRVGGGAKVALSVISEGGRSGMAAISCGLIRACLEDSIKFSKERIIYDKPLSSLGTIQAIIAENRMDYEAARILTYQALGMKDNGESCVEHIAIAKLYATEAAVRSAKRTIDLMGGYGVIDDYPVCRYLRDAIATIPSGGTSEIMRIVIAGANLA